VLLAGTQDQPELADRLVDVPEVRLDVDVAADDAERLARDLGFEIGIEEVQLRLDVILLADGRVFHRGPPVLSTGWRDGSQQGQQRPGGHLAGAREIHTTHVHLLGPGLIEH
jgi:hypothetical protein